MSGLMKTNKNPLYPFNIRKRSENTNIKICYFPCFYWLIRKYVIKWERGSKHCLAPTQQFFSYFMARTNYFRWDDDEFRFVLDQQDLYCASALQQHSADRHVTHLTHYPDSEPTSLCSFPLILRAKRKQQIPNFIVFGLTRSGLEHTIYRTRGKHANH
jgi:hypothetical protein